MIEPSAARLRVIDRRRFGRRARHGATRRGRTRARGLRRRGADLRSRVAPQYRTSSSVPVHLGQGVHRWTLAVALPALLGIRVRGPIAAAGRTPRRGRAGRGSAGSLASGNRARACRAAGWSAPWPTRGESPPNRSPRSRGIRSSETSRLEVARAELLAALDRGGRAAPAAGGRRPRLGWRQRNGAARAGAARSARQALHPCGAR
jgi:hypothetical protein